MCGPGQSAFPNYQKILTLKAAKSIGSAFQLLVLPFVHLRRWFLDINEWFSPGLFQQWAVEVKADLNCDRIGAIL
jgi:hypothetical protein